MKCVEEVALEKLLPGMVVAEAVVDDAGRILIPAGAPLSESLIASLARREIAGVRIVREVEEDAAEKESYRLSLLSRMEHLFRHAGEGELVRTLHQVMFDYRMEHRL